MQQYEISLRDKPFPSASSFVHLQAQDRRDPVEAPSENWTSWYWLAAQEFRSSWSQLFLSCPSPYTASQRGRPAWSLQGRGCRRPRTHRAPPPAAELASLTHEDHPLFLIFWSPNSTNLSVLVLYWHIKRPTEHGGNLLWDEPDTSESRFATTAPAEPPPADQHHLAVKDISSARITYDDKVVMSTDPPHVGNSVFRIPSCRTIELHQLWGEINRLVSKHNHEKIQKASKLKLCWIWDSKHGKQSNI